MRRSKTLVLVSLARNEIGNKGASRIADALLDNTQLQYLDLSHNQSVPGTLDLKNHD